MQKLYLLVALLANRATAATPQIDCRADFEADAYMAIAMDSFASADLNNYVNPVASGIIKERAIAGFDFQYRLAGNQANPSRHQLWVYGRTEHGMRSADVGLPGVQPPGAFIYMLRNATSLESFTGLRWEFPALQRSGGNAARPYLNAQFGFLTVAGSGTGAIGVHHLGLGLTTTTGRFLHSFLEVGFGRTGLFLRRPNSRLKVHAYLEWQSKVFSAMKARPFVQMTVDSDHGPGADSVQTALGLKFDLDKIF